METVSRFLTPGQYQNLVWFYQACEEEDESDDDDEDNEDDKVRCMEDV